MRVIRDHGMRKDKRYWHDAIGYNFRLTNLQAAIGCAQLENIDKAIAKRRQVYQFYLQNLEGKSGFALQRIKEDVEPVIWALGLKIDPNAFKVNRDQLMEKLLGEGIETRPGFYPFCVMPIYKARPLAISMDVGANVICLPFYSSLKGAEVKFICHTLFKYLK